MKWDLETYKDGSNFHLSDDLEYSKPSIYKSFKYNNLYMDAAVRCSEMSYAVRAKVGAVLVKNGSILSHGWNGMPAGAPNVCEEEILLPYNVKALKTLPFVQHAEENLLLKMLKLGQSPELGTLYVTLEPCLHCAKMIYGAGISRVYYLDEYRDHSGVEFLRKFGVDVTKMGTK